jgi:hypothetical protein
MAWQIKNRRFATTIHLGIKRDNGFPAKVARK